MQRAPNRLKHGLDQIGRGHELYERNRLPWPARRQLLAQHRLVARRRDDDVGSQRPERVERRTGAVARHDGELEIQEQRFPEEQMRRLVGHDERQGRLPVPILQTATASTLTPPVAAASPPLLCMHKITLALRASAHVGLPNYGTAVRPCPGTSARHLLPAALRTCCRRRGTWRRPR